MHGPGGSGKSWVIDLIMLYAKEYSDLIPNFVFHKRTIIVTAMTGSAATLINGETAHQVLQIYRRKIDITDVEEFQETRLIIIDEISFASMEEVHKINFKLQALRAPDCNQME